MMNLRMNAWCIQMWLSIRVISTSDLATATGMASNVLNDSWHNMRIAGWMK